MHGERSGSAVLFISARSRHWADGDPGLAKLGLSSLALDDKGSLCGVDKRDIAEQDDSAEGIKRSQCEFSVLRGVVVSPRGFKRSDDVDPK